MNNTANGNEAFYEQLTSDNAAMLLIDHQAGLFLGVHSMDQQVLKNNAIALAKTAKVFNLPTVLFTSSAKGPNGPGTVDTDFSKNASLPKIAPAEVASAALQAVMDEVEDVYPGEEATNTAEQLRHDPKAIEKLFAAMLPT